VKELYLKEGGVNGTTEHFRHYWRRGWSI
jgi:hypothetical protein